MEEERRHTAPCRVTGVFVASAGVIDEADGTLRRLCPLRKFGKDLGRHNWRYGLTCPYNTNEEFIQKCKRRYLHLLADGS